MCSKRKFIDIGANLMDSVYSGIYNGKKIHNADLDNVLERAVNAGIEKVIITGTDLEESEQAVVSITERGSSLSTRPAMYTTVGCHPTRCNSFDKDPDQYYEKMAQLVKNNMNIVVAVGECGLDYDRLQFCEKDIQKIYFEKQLILSKKLKLPLFLHCRNSADDFISIVERHKDFVGGVVHSFDGTEDAMFKMINLGLYIGINGCSLKTEDNLNVVKKIPRDRILIETDAPWCEVRPSHAGSKFIGTRFSAVKKEKWQSDCIVKGRNEPCNLVQILEILSAVRKEDPDELLEQIYENTHLLFFNN